MLQLHRNKKLLRLKHLLSLLQKMLAQLMKIRLLKKLRVPGLLKKFQPLNEEEQKIIQQAQRILGNSSTIPCTACHYCTEGCPKHIPIPEIFTAMNKQLGNGQMAEAVSDYQKVNVSGGLASECIDCKQCEHVCPQHLGITGYLKQCADKLEK